MCGFFIFYYIVPTFQILYYSVFMKSQQLKKTKLPDSPGVYFFKNGENVLYIGRATSLRDRARSYFSNDLVQTRGALIVEMVEKANNIKFKKTDSVLEAIILEANLIKKYQPFYNTKEKDDKSFNYVVITEEDFPQILITRGRNLNLKAKSSKLKAFFGPFPNGSALQEALKFIRKIFPYRDEKCKPCFYSRESASSLRKSAFCRPCFNRHIDLCPGVCTGEISKKDYAKTIRYIIKIFEGKKKSVLFGLEREMKDFSKKEEFEKAGNIRNKIFALTHIRDVAFIKKEKLTADSEQSEAYRIEAYDTAHLGGKNTRGVMVVMDDGEFNKNEYRVFTIKSAKGGDDIGALSEILERRFKHNEWRFPNIAVIDGGRAQLNTALKIIKKYSSKTEVVSVVKDDRHKAREILNVSDNLLSFKQNILKLNAEAHRFAIAKYRRVERKWLT